MDNQNYHGYRRQDPPNNNPQFQQFRQADGYSGDLMQQQHQNINNFQADNRNFNNRYTQRQYGENAPVNQQAQVNNREAKMGYSHGANISPQTTMAAKEVVKCIQTATDMRKRSSVIAFFFDFDAHERRVFEQWEIELIFKISCKNKVSNSALSELSESNRKEEEIRMSQISFQYFRKCLLAVSNDFNNCPRPLPKVSYYDMVRRGESDNPNLITSATAEDLLKQIAGAIDPTGIRQWWSQNFKVDQIIDARQFQEALMLSNIKMEEKFAEELVLYFSQDDRGFQMNMIQFIQGLKPWKKEQGKGETEAARQRAEERKISLKNGPTQTQEAEQKNWTRVKQLLTRMSNYKKSAGIAIPDMFRKDKFEAFDNSKRLSYDWMEFKRDLEQGNLRMTPDEVNCLGKWFLCRTSKKSASNAQYVDIEKLHAEVVQFDRAISEIFGKHEANLTLLKIGLQRRYSGPYNWFKSYANVQNDTLRENDFITACNALKMEPEVSQADLQDLFLMVAKESSRSSDGQINREFITTVDLEELFKAFAQHSRGFKRQETGDPLLVKIIRAFNCNIQALEQELATHNEAFASGSAVDKNFMSYDAFVNVFFQYSEFEKAYSETDVFRVAENFVYTKGKIDAAAFIRELFATKKEARLVHIPTEKGIQANPKKSVNELREMRVGHLERKRPGFSTDCTKVAMDGQSQEIAPPYGFIRQAKEDSINELQKACFVQSSSIEAYFTTFLRLNETALVEGDFIDAVKDLNLLNARNPSEEDQDVWAQCFSDIDYALNNKHEEGRLTPAQIDQYVSFVTPVHQNPTIQQQHTALLKEMGIACKKHKLKLDQIIISTQRGADHMQMKDLELVIINSMRLTWTQLWRRFVASKYCQEGDSKFDKITASALLADLNKQVMLIETSSLGGKKATTGADGKSMKAHQVLPVIKKAVLGFELNLLQMFEDHRNVLTKENFLDEFGGLQAKIVPEYVSEAALAECYHFIDDSQRGDITLNELYTKITENSAEDGDMLREIVRRNETCDKDLLKQKLGLKFGRADAKVSLNEFVGFLQDPEVGMTALDANFIGFLCRDPPNGSQVGIAKLIENIDATSPTDPYAKQDQSEMKIKLQAECNQILRIIAEHFQMHNIKVDKMIAQSMRQTLVGQNRVYSLGIQSFKDLIRHNAQNILPMDIDKLGSNYMKNDHMHIDTQKFISDFSQFYESPAPTPNSNQIQYFKRFQKVLEYDKEAIINPTVKEIAEQKRKVRIVGQAWWLREFAYEARGMDQKREGRMTGFLPYEELKGLISKTCVAQYQAELANHLEQERKAGPVRREALNKMRPQETVFTQSQLTEMIKVLPPNRESTAYSYKMMLQLMYTHAVATELLTCHITELIKHRAEQRAKQPQIKFTQQPAKLLGGATEQPGASAEPSPAGQMHMGAAMARKVTFVKTRPLDQNQLLECQQSLFRIYDEIVAAGKVPTSEFGSYSKTSRGQLTPSELNSAVKRSSPGFFSTFDLTTKEGKAHRSQTLTHMVFYLVSEAPQHASLLKLGKAWEQLRDAPPLAQEEGGLAPEQASHQQLQQQHLLSGRSNAAASSDRRATPRSQDALSSRAGQVPHSVTQLCRHMHDKGQSISATFDVPSADTSITKEAFEAKLRQSPFQVDDQDSLTQALVDPSNPALIQLTRLVDFNNKLYPTSSAQGIKSRIGNLDPVIREKIKDISDYLVRNEITIQSFHSMLDSNKDNFVDKKEFVNGCMHVLKISRIEQQDYNKIFDVLDYNGDGKLNISELQNQIYGAQKKRHDSLYKRTPAMDQSLDKEIAALFNLIDENGNGKIEAKEIQKTMASMNYPISMEQAQAMIARPEIDTDASGALELNEFKKLMMPVMLDHVFKIEDQVEEFRAEFRDADLDCNGYLNMDEFYSVMRSIGAQVTRKELRNLMLEFDIDSDMHIDIDEFVMLMTRGDELKFNNPEAKMTYFKLKRGRSITCLDFMGSFRKLPKAFMPSFFKAAWTKRRENLPSSVFKAQIDPQTMLWKDIHPVSEQELAARKPHEKSSIRPINSDMQCEISFNSAQGIPLPQTAAEIFDRNDIVKRAVRVGLYNSENKKLIYNTAQVNAAWDQKSEDKWTFPTSSALNPILFRHFDYQTDGIEGLSKPLDGEKVFFIFEFVLYVRAKKDCSNPDGTPSYVDVTKEYSCCYAQTEVKNAATPTAKKMTLELFGGSPRFGSKIDGGEINKARTGIVNAFKKLAPGSGNIQPKVEVTFNPIKANDFRNYHLSLMPSTCVINSAILPFVSGFRDYTGKQLLKINQNRKPGGDVTMAVFPKLFDNIDILEDLATRFHAEFCKLHSTGKTNISALGERARELIYKLYPILYTTGFQYNEVTFSDSACANAQLFKERQRLLDAVFKPAVTAPLESMTQFKPFNIRELDLQVWDSRDADNFRMLHQYENQGIINMQDLDKQVEMNGNQFGLRDFLNEPNAKIKLDTGVQPPVEEQ